MRAQIPDRGDIFHLDLSPSSGREQRGRHYAVVLTTREYNATHLPFAAPITTVGNASRFGGMYVSLSGAGTSITGIVQLDQTRAFDFGARGASKTVERLPPEIVGDMLDRLAALFE